MVRVSGPSHVTAHGPLSSRLARPSLAGMLTHPPLIDGLIGTLPASVRGRGVPCPHESDRLRRRLVDSHPRYAPIPPWTLLRRPPDESSPICEAPWRA